MYSPLNITFSRPDTIISMYQHPLRDII